MSTENRSSNTEIATDQLPPCSDDVFKNGVSVCLVGDVPKHAAETICQSLSGVTGWKIDWHYIGGRTHIMALAQPAEQFQGEPGGYPQCDYCGIVPDHHPWHGSGLLSGVETRHIHACDACRGRLPLHPEQHQREPVALPARRQWNGLGNAADNLKASGWNACLDAIAKIGPLYTHPDPGEVERLTRKCQNADLALKVQTQNCDSLRAQLAERDALLRRCLMAVREQHCDEDEADFDLPANLMTEIDVALDSKS